MVLLVRAEKVSFRVEAESFVQEPFAAFYVRLFTVVIRLIAATDELLPLFSSIEKPNCFALVDSISKKVTFRSLIVRVSASETQTRCSLSPIKRDCFFGRSCSTRLWSRK